VALSVLNLLAERPMHPYEMRVLMRQRHHDRAFQIRESSVYDAVQASRSLAAGSVLTGPVGLGFLVTGTAAALALWWGTRSYQRAMA
jgi:hypothetical protein